jgi:hypothetical protein
MYTNGARGSVARHYATNQKVAGSNPEAEDFFF